MSGSSYVKAQREQKRMRAAHIKELPPEQARMQQAQWTVQDWFTGELDRGRMLDEVLNELVHLCAMSVGDAVYIARMNNMLMVGPEDSINSMAALVAVRAVTYEAETSHSATRVPGGTA